MSKVTIKIDIKEEFKNSYRFPENFENIFIIDIQDLKSSIGDFLFGIINSLNWRPLPSQSKDMEIFLCQNIDSFDFQNATSICIPIVFHILEGADFQQSSLNDIIETLNSAFFNSKIQFVFDSSISFNIPENNYNLININDIDNLPKEIDKLNIYISDYLGLGNGIDQEIQALAHTPVFDVFTNAIFIRSRFINQTHYPNQPLLSHEIGHTFSLYHTFQPNTYNHNQCPTYYEGDGIIETTPQNNHTPPQGSICSDWNNSNYMSYSYFFGYSNQCDYSFVADQNKRMRLAAEYWLSNIFCENSQSTIPTVNTNIVSDITETTATSGGDIIDDGGSNVTLRGVCWSTNPNPTTSDYTTNNGTGIGSFISLLTGLIENTTYYLKAYATNSEGTAYGNEINFTTLLSSGNIYYGDVELNTQQEVDIFGSNNYSGIDGYLFIDSNISITTLEPLNSLQSVTGVVAISHNDQLPNIDGLSNLSSVGSISLSSNMILTNLNGLSNISAINGSLEIGGNPMLTDISELSNINIVGGVLRIQENNSLTALALEEINISSVGELRIVANQGLLSISGLSSINTVMGDLYISNNDFLTNLEGINNILSVGGNLSIRFHNSLTDLCALESLILNGGYGGNIDISLNLYNPTIQDFINGDCSQ